MGFPRILQGQKRKKGLQDFTCVYKFGACRKRRHAVGQRNRLRVRGDRTRPEEQVEAQGKGEPQKPEDATVASMTDEGTMTEGNSESKEMLQHTERWR